MTMMGRAVQLNNLASPVFVLMICLHFNQEVRVKTGVPYGLLAKLLASRCSLFIFLPPAAFGMHRSF